MKSLHIVEAPRLDELPLSQSRYENMACPHLYRASVLGDDRDNPAAQRGRQIHDFLAQYVDHLVQMNLKRDWAWFSAQMDGMGIDESALGILAGIRDSLEVDPQQVLNIEERLYLDHLFRPIEFRDRNDWLNLAYEGKPDLVLLDGATATIPDYKSQFKIEGANTFQGQLYALLVMQHYSFVEKVIFELHFVRWRTKKQAIFTRDDLPALKKAAENARRRQQELHVMIEQGIAGSTLPAMPGAHCVGCPLLHKTCPIKDNPFSESPEANLREVIWAKHFIAKRMEVLKAQLNRSGDITGLGGKIKYLDGNGNEYKAEFVPVQKSSYPLKDTLPVIEAWKETSGEDLSDKVKVGATELNSLSRAKKRALLAEMLIDARQIATETKMVISGVDEDEEE